MGLLLGCFGYLLFSILVSLRLNTGAFYFALPALAKECGNEFFAALLQIFLFAWLGTACGIAFQFSENTELEPAKQGVGYLASLTVGILPLGWAGHWWEHVFIGAFSYVIIISVISLFCFFVTLAKTNRDVKEIKRAIGLHKEFIRKNSMKKFKLSSKQMIIWLCINYGLFILAFFTLGFISGNRGIVILNFGLDVLLCAVSLFLNIGLFSAKHKTPMAGKIGLLFTTLCFMAFTYFVFLMPENGLPPILFQ